MRVPRLIFFRSFNFSIQSVPYSSTHSSIPFIYTRAHTYVIQPVPYRTESEKSTSLNEIHVGTGTVLKPWHGIHFIASLFEILNTRARARTRLLSCRSCRAAFDVHLLLLRWLMMGADARYLFHVRQQHNVDRKNVFNGTTYRMKCTVAKRVVASTGENNKAP